MIRSHPDLWLTAALLTAAALVVAWATMPARRPGLVLPKVPVGMERLN